MKKIIMLMMITVMALSIFSGCTNNTKADSSANTTNSTSNETSSEEGVQVELPKFMAIGTGAAGGAFYPIGISVGDIITNNLGIQTTAQVTGGALENINLVNSGELDMGITMGNAALMAYEGTGMYDEAHENLSGLFGGLSKGYFQVVVLNDSDIQTMEDLVGKKVVMGPAGNGAISVANTIWSEYGFSVDDVDATYIAYTDGISSLTDGNCDAVVIQTAIPASAVQELAASGADFRLVDIDEDVAASLEAKYAYFGHGTISAAVYGNNDDAVTMYITNMMVIRADLDEDLVYEITKVLFENLSTIQESHKAASGLTLEGAAKSSIPLHPGAQRYFEEIGVYEK